MPIFVDGNVGTYHSSTFGAVSPQTVQYLTNQVQQLASNPAMHEQYQRSRMMFEQINGETAQRVARAIEMNNQAMWNANLVRPLLTLEDLQTAPLIMQRWIMTNEYLRTMAQEGRINGYNESYVDAEPGLVGKEHTDWRLLHQGVLIDVPEADWRLENYYEEPPEGEHRLLLIDRENAISAAEFAEMHARRMEDDPTSPYGDMM